VYPLLRMSLGSRYDSRVIKVLALAGIGRSTTHIARELKVDDGALTIELFRMAKEGFIEICGADGSTPVWALTDEGRTRSEGLRPWYPFE
jgi:DNA-binding MarR family transcriptional regulator